MKFKNYGATFKALEADGSQPGAFEAIVAVFDNTDRAGDRLKSTAFDATLKAWRDSGDPIPVILSHKWDDPMAIVGHADPNDVKSIPGKGLYVKGHLHVGRGNEVADQVHYLMGQRLLKEFSFGFTTPEGGESRAADGVYDIKAVNLIEFGPCLKGVNEQTELLAVKATLAIDEPRVDTPADPAAGKLHVDIVVDSIDASAITAGTVTSASISAPAIGAEVSDPTPDPPADPTAALDPEKHTDVLVYEAAIENLESHLGVGFDDDALETARLDADIDAQLGA